MPRYTVSVPRTLILTTHTAVSAPDAHVAYDTVTARMEQGACGVLVWDVDQCQAEIDDWQEDSIATMTVEEKP